MSELDEIVSVTITRQTAVPSMASFSEHLIADLFNPVGIKPRFDRARRVRTFGGIEEVAAAGFSADSWVYRAAARQFSQSPHINRIYVGWKAPEGLYEATVKISAEFKAGQTIKVTLNSSDLVEFAFDEAGTSEACVKKIADAINERFAGSMEAQASGALEISVFGAEPRLELQVTGGSGDAPTASVEAKKIDADASWTEALDAMARDANGGFYACEIHSDKMAEQQELALWAQANERLAGIVTHDPAAVDGDGDIADWLKTSNIDRAFCFYHPTDDLVVSAVFGKMLSKHPGSATWAHKGFEATPVSTLAAGQRSAALKKNCNIYTSVADMPLSRWGTVGSGEYIDVVHGCDWLKAKIQQLVLTPLVQRDKVPFDDAGIEAVKAQLKAALEQGVAHQILKAGAYTIECPTADEVEAAAKAERLLPNVRFSAPLAGAIHKTSINGVVTL